MKDDFISVLKEDNLCTYYLLPLIGLNKFSFGSSNFINSYVVRGGEFVVVRVCDVNLCPTMLNHPRLAKHVHLREHDDLLFWIPGWYEDFQKFEQGKYSEFSEAAKELIILNSGLMYKYPLENGGTRTDARLMALTRNPALLDYWSRELDIHSLSSMDELMIKPGEDCFIEWEG